MANNVFGEAIQRERRRRGWTQEDVAKRLSVSQGHVSNIETGRSSDADAIARICTMLELDYEALLARWFGVVTTTEAAIMDDPMLRDDHRHLLRVLYREMKDQGPLAKIAAAQD